jgi:hypothetical protein
MKIWLDDERKPDLDWSVWQICQSVAEAQDVIKGLGWPDFISFDHDLGNGPIGYDLAKWLVERDPDHHDMPENFRFQVHSANPSEQKISDPC